MKLSFKRITSSGSFMPEIDGLRFIAIVSVVLYHLSGFFAEKDLRDYSENIDYSFLKNILSHGHLGVPLFFVISGFILGLPFARYHMIGQNPIDLKKYFLRRLTRLEPPYIISMTILLFGAVYIAKTVSFQEGVLSYVSSIFYIHNFMYPELLPKLNGVAWSLEIEIQFYILAPLMAYVFLLKNTSFRRMLLFFLVIFFLTINYIFDFKYLNLLNYIHYFLIGFILVDLHVSNSTIFSASKYDYLVGIALFMLIWVFDESDFNSNKQKFLWELTQLIAIFFLYYYVLFHKIFKFLSLRIITNIGGMCYTIYLLHYPIISMFGNPLLKLTFSKYALVNTSIYSIFLLSLVMFISSIFFILVERPCMDKDWVKKLAQNLKKIKM